MFEHLVSTWNCNLGWGSFMLQKPEINAGPMGYLARMQTSYTYIQNEKYRTLYMGPVK